MNPIVLIGGICLVVAGVVLAVASVVLFADAVYEGTRRGVTRTESESVWHAAIMAQLPRLLVGTVLAVLGAALLGWFAS